MLQISVKGRDCIVTLYSNYDYEEIAMDEEEQEEILTYLRSKLDLDPTLMLQWFFSSFVH